MIKRSHQHGLYKNLQNGCIYNSQAAAVIFVCAFAYKLAAAPSIVSEACESSTLWVYIFMSILDVLFTTSIFYFARQQADSFLLVKQIVFYRALCLVASIWLALKGTLYFAYSSAYLSHELFAGVEPTLIYLVFLVPIVYVGAKGVRTISRSCEIIYLFILGAAIMNLAFLKTNMDFGRNLPVFSKEPAELFADIPSFGLWLGDLLPFAFVKIKNKRAPYITISIGVTWILILISVALGIAIHGESLRMVADLFINLAAFNQLSLDIGRMEWTNLFGMLTMSIYSLSFIYWGVIAASSRALKTDVPAKAIFPFALIVVSILVPSTQAVTDFAIGTFGYVMFTLALALPILFVATFVYHKRRSPQLYANLNVELRASVAHFSACANSLADGILNPFKKSAKQNGKILPNGTIETDGELQNEKI